MSRSKNNNSSEIKKNVDKLIQTIYHGNGSPSVLNQITKLEGRIGTLESHQESRFNSLEKEMDLKFENITEVVTEKFKNLSNLIESEFKIKNTNAEKSWTHRTAVATGLIASVTSLLVLLVSEFIKAVKIFP